MDMPLKHTWWTGKGALMVDLVHVDDVLRLLLDLSHIQRPGRAVLNIVDNVGKQISLYHIKLSPKSIACYISG